MNDKTTITIDKKIYQKLREKGRFGETYTQLISRLIEGDTKANLGEERKDD
jgi:predicted CopG family antitoxin